MFWRLKPFLSVVHVQNASAPKYLSRIRKRHTKHDATIRDETRPKEFQGPPNGGVSNGGVSRSGHFCPFLSFFVLFFSFLGLSRFFRDFPDLLGDGPGIFPIRPFSLSRPIKSTYEEQSRKGPRHNQDLSRKEWETPGFGNPPVYLLSRIAPNDADSQAVVTAEASSIQIRRPIAV